MAKRKAGGQIGNLTPDHLKSGINPISLRVGNCDILLESSWQRLQLCFRHHRNQRSAQEVMCRQSRGSPSCANFETKNHVDVPPMESCKVYYKGEGGEFPQVMAVVSLVCLSCPWLILPPKVLQLCTNHFGLVLCKSVWVIEACHFFLVPSRSSNMPLYPSIMPRVREGPLLFALSLFFVRIPISNIGVHLGV
jgi:hypothetical protein